MSGMTTAVNITGVSTGAQSPGEPQGAGATGFAAALAAAQPAQDAEQPQSPGAAAAQQPIVAPATESTAAPPAPHKAVPAQKSARTTAAAALPGVAAALILPIQEQGAATSEGSPANPTTSGANTHAAPADEDGKGDANIALLALPAAATAAVLGAVADTAQPSVPGPAPSAEAAAVSLAADRSAMKTAASALPKLPAVTAMQPAAPELQAQDVAAGSGRPNGTAPAVTAMESKLQAAAIAVAAAVPDAAVVDSSTVAATTTALPQQAPVATYGASPDPRVVLHAPVGTSRWTEQLGNQLVLMSVRGQHEGSLTLTPEHLGPVEVRISVNQDTANVWFGAQQPETRAALAEAMPRLRELFAASGMSLGQAGVSQEAPRRDPQEPVARGFAATAGDAAAADLTAPVARVLRSTLIDTWA